MTGNSEESQGSPCWRHLIANSAPQRKTREVSETSEIRQSSDSAFHCGHLAGSQDIAVNADGCARPLVACHIYSVVRFTGSDWLMQMTQAWFCAGHKYQDW
jgi:hypothetical protein